MFDALEDAAFSHTHDLEGKGTLNQIEAETKQKSLTDALAERLKDFAVRLVLTAHPTQFYPDSVLGIIYDLSKSIADNNITEINLLLQQLGKTPFSNISSLPLLMKPIVSSGTCVIYFILLLEESIRESTKWCQSPLTNKTHWFI